MSILGAWLELRKHRASLTQGFLEGPGSDCCRICAALSGVDTARWLFLNVSEPRMVTIPTTFMPEWQCMTVTKISALVLYILKFLDCLFLILLKLLKGQCVIEMVTAFLKDLQGKSKPLYDVIQTSWFWQVFPEEIVYDIAKPEKSFQKRRGSFGII